MEHESPSGRRDEQEGVQFSSAGPCGVSACASGGMEAECKTQRDFLFHLKTLSLRNEACI